MSNTNLKKVSTYAREVGKVQNTIYRWIREGKLKGEIIDGVWYVVVDAQPQEPILN